MPRFKLKITATLILAFVALSIHATEQISEQFEVDGVSFEIEQYPLSPHISEEDFLAKFATALCTANWRGYKGYWALRNNELVLVHLLKNACSEKKEIIPAQELFNKPNYPVKANWFTGEIIVRISERTYLDPNVAGYSGMKFQAVVYSFDKGDLLSREIKVIEKKW